MTEFDAQRDRAEGLTHQPEAGEDGNLGSDDLETLEGPEREDDRERLPRPGEGGNLGG